MNLGYVGRSLPPTEPAIISADAVARFAAALGHSGAGLVSVPPTFLISLTLPAADPLIDDPGFGLDFSRVLHREQRFEYVRAPRVGDRVSCVVTVDSIKVVAGNELLSLRTDVTAADDEPVAVVHTTLFVAAEPAEET
ncbi:MAG: FAS1-like dehydratase domain-containing protein [Stackebrandtia sp.]